MESRDAGTIRRSKRTKTHHLPSDSSICKLPGQAIKNRIAVERKRHYTNVAVSSFKRYKYFQDIINRVRENPEPLFAYRKDYRDFLLENDEEFKELLSGRQDHKPQKEGFSDRASEIYPNEISGEICMQIVDSTANPGAAKEVIDGIARINVEPCVEKDKLIVRQSFGVKIRKKTYKIGKIGRGKLFRSDNLAQYLSYKYHLNKTKDVESVFSKKQMKYLLNLLNPSFRYETPSIDFKKFFYHNPEVFKEFIAIQPEKYNVTTSSYIQKVFSRISPEISTNVSHNSELLTDLTLQSIKIIDEMNHFRNLPHFSVAGVDVISTAIRIFIKHLIEKKCAKQGTISQGTDSVISDNEMS